MRCHGQIENWELAFEVRSFSNPETWYEVSVRLDDGTCKCSCMDAVGRRKNHYADLVSGNCKHVRHLVKVAYRLNRIRMD